MNIPYCDYCGKYILNEFKIIRGISLNIYYINLCPYENKFMKFLWFLTFSFYTGNLGNDCFCCQKHYDLYYKKLENKKGVLQR